MKPNTIEEYEFPIKYSRFLKGLFIALFMVLQVKASAPDFKVIYIISPGPIDPFEKLVNAVVQVESSGDTMAFNKAESAVGAFQIRPIRLLDYNLRTGNNYTISDCYNFKISRKMFLYYANRIGYHDYESVARSWNGSGKTTLDYWGKVKIYL